MSARPLSSFALKPLAAACLLALSLPAAAATYTVNNEADLIAAINAVNASTGANFIEFKGNVTLSAALPPITGTVTIKGNGKTLSGDTDGDGAGDVQLLVLGSNTAPGTSVLVQISGLTLKDGLAQGADGTAGGDGASGTGGALQINSNADVELQDVKILESRAVGGNGDVTDGNGGNALGGGVYVAAGGRVSISGSANASSDPLAADSNIAGGAVTAGNGTGAGVDGTAAGSGIYLAGAGNLRLSANPGKVLRIDDSISDSVGAGTGTQSWNLILTGGGGVPSDTTDPSADLIYGTIILGGNNNYGGDTYIRDVNVGINSMGALGSGGVVALDNGGLVVADGMDVNRELVLASGGGRIGVFSGQGILSGDVSGSGDLMKVGLGDLQLLGQSNFTGDWIVREGALVLTDNAQLGANPDLILDGGGLKFSADVNNLRGFDLTSRGGYIDSNGNDVGLANAITGWNGDVTLTFRDSSGTGTGITTLTGNNTGTGNTKVESGIVVGAIAKGDLTVEQDATYRLGSSDRQISALQGEGAVELGTHKLNIVLDYDTSNGGTAPTFSGVISGDGSLVLSSSTPSFSWLPGLLVSSVNTGDFRSQLLTGSNSYTGGTTVGNSVLLKMSSVGSLGTGPLTLQDGALEVSSGTLALDINLAGGVGILQTTGNVNFTGHLIGSADFLKQGNGTLTLSSANAGMTGDTVVAGAGSYVALANVDALGSGSLVLTDGGGLKLLADTTELRPVRISQGEGVIDTGNHSVMSSGNITGVTGLLGLAANSRLVKEGSGDLILTGSVNLAGGMDIRQGTVQLGDGGSTGSFGGKICFFLLGCSTFDINIGSGAQLVVNRSNNISLSDPIIGSGELVKKGSGLLSLSGTNSFSGGLTVLEGYVTGDADAAYGTGTILLDGGGLQLSSDLYRTLALGSNNGSLQVAGVQEWRFGGQLTGSGNLIKTGTGTLIYTGVADQTGIIEVAAGKLQVGEGYVGTLLGNVQVDSGATLAFARDDLTQYGGVVSGDGDVVKQGLGELVLTGDHLFAGDLVITNGTVRLGNGGSTGSLTGGADLQNGSNLIVDRSGVAEISEDLKGNGNLRMVGTGELRLPGDSHLFTGHSYIDNGSIRLNGQLGGDMDVASGALLQGTGNLLGNLVLASGARFAPGNSIGTMNVASLTMNSGSVLEIEVNDAGASDKVVVSGTASLAGELRVKPLPGDYSQPGCCTFTILTASAVNGTFDQVINDLAFINTNVNYLPTSVELEFIRNAAGFGSIPGLTWNQQQVSGALDKLEAQDPANPLVQLVVPLTTAEATQAYTLLSGDSLLSAANASSRMGFRFNHLLTSRSSRLGLASRGGNTGDVGKSLTAVRSGSMPEAPAAFGKEAPASFSAAQHYDGPTSKVEGLWLEANGFKLSEDSDDTVGSASSTLSGQLLALGIDGYWSDNFILGFGAGYMTGTLEADNRQADGDATAQFIGSYARWESASGWHYKTALTLAQQNTDQKRNGTIGGVSAQATSSVDVQSATLEFEAGLALHLGSFGLRPYVLLDAQMLKRDAIEESGAGPADLSVAAESDVIGDIGLGMEVSRPWLTSGARWAQLVAGVALLQPVGDTQREQTVSFSGANDSFTIKATPNDSAALQLTFGGEWYLSKSLALWGGYEGRISGSTQEHNGVLSFQYRW
ncbi:MAG: autotransporter domain-containing protein [Pedobacter sp.]|nr:autotransporter domain-containing protein [Pedobacter sp.]